MLVGLEQDGGTQKWAFTSSFRAKRGTIRREIPFLRSNPQLLRWIASLFVGASGFCLQADVDRERWMANKRTDVLVFGVLDKTAGNNI